MRRKRKKNFIKVLFRIVALMIIVGGFGVGRTYFNNDNKDNYDNKYEENKQVDSNKEQDDNIIEDDNSVTDIEDNDSDVTNSTLNKAPESSVDYKNLNDGEYLTDKGYTLKVEGGVATIDGLLIVNKTYSLPSTYQPANPKNAITSAVCNSCLDVEVMDAFNLMKSDAASLGLNIWVQSGYRSYVYQDTLYNNYVARDGVAMADTYSARAGHSEHQTGLCFDLNSIDDSFAYTNEGKWVNNNAHLYGFIIRYPKGKESITGYQYESWHLRYVGKDLANILYNNGNWVTIEEHFGISSSY